MPPEGTLLVVDDEKAILETYRHDLAADLESQVLHTSRAPSGPPGPPPPHYRLLLADTGEKAVRLVEEETQAGRRIWAGFFDMKMPGGIDGLETIERVRAIDGDVLCCVVTAFQDRSIDDIARLFPGHEDEWDYLNKPFTQLEIRQKARALTSSWWRRRGEEEHRADLERLVGALTSLRDFRAPDLARVLDHVAREMLGYAGGGGKAVVVTVEGGELVPGTSSGRSALVPDGATTALLRHPAVVQAAHRALARGAPDADGHVTVIPFGGLAPPRVALLVHGAPLPDDRRKLLSIFAENAAAAIENHRLYRELRELNASLEDRVAHQVRDIRAANERLHEVARTDPLTAVGNRLRLREDLEALRARVLRYGHHYCAVLCDVDHFKNYNDRYGHLAGDEALRRVVDAIRSTVRGGDALYRFGGEEFLVILPEQTLDGATRAAERIRQAVEDARISNAGLGPEAVVTISAGIAALPPGEGRPIEEWLKRADAALYQAKGRGRNRVAVWDRPESDDGGLLPPAVSG